MWVPERVTVTSRCQDGIGTFVLLHSMVIDAGEDYTYALYKSPQKFSYLERGDVSEAKLSAWIQILSNYRLTISVPEPQIHLEASKTMRTLIKSF